MGDNEQNKKRKYWLYFLCFITMGALLSVEAGVDDITCLAGLTCNPNPLSGSSFAMLSNASTSTIGGVVVTNCSTGYFVSGWNSSIGPICTLGNGSSSTWNITGSTWLINNSGQLDWNSTLGDQRYHELNWTLPTSNWLYNNSGELDWNTTQGDLRYAPFGVVNQNQWTMPISNWNYNNSGSIDWNTTKGDARYAPFGVTNQNQWDVPLSNWLYNNSNTLDWNTTKGDLRYLLLTGGTLTGNLYVPSHGVTASWFSGLMNWTDLDAYPASCNSATQFMTGVGDTLTCTADSSLANTHTHKAENITAGNFSGLQYNFDNNLSVNSNFTVGGYIVGQPITGSIGSGIIKADNITSRGSLNVTCYSNNLTCYYPSFTARIVDVPNEKPTYCTITGAFVEIPDNAHTIYYLDSTCIIKTTNFADYFDLEINTGRADFFNAMAHSGGVESYKGVSVENRIQTKVRDELYYVNHLEVVQGMGRTIGSFATKDIKIDSGKYVYLREVVSTTTRNTTTNGLELFYHTSATTWGFVNRTGLNLTHCDNGTAIVPCVTTGNRYRRYFLFMMGWNGTTDSTELHQSAALENTFYTTLASCLDTITNPIIYNLPSEYLKTIVPLYAYCAQANDVAWRSDGWIDLRTTKATTSTSGIDLTPYLTRDGSRSLTGNWSAGNYNITANTTVVDSIYNAYGGNVTFYDDITLPNSNVWAGMGNFSNMTIATINFTVDSQHHGIVDNTTCVVISGDTSTLSIC